MVAQEERKLDENCRSQSARLDCFFASFPKLKQATASIRGGKKVSFADVASSRLKMQFTRMLVFSIISGIVVVADAGVGTSVPGPIKTLEETKVVQPLTDFPEVSYAVFH
ncbi:hypothetical protein JOM56_010446 [Amanita muscaria]